MSHDNEIDLYLDYVDSEERLLFTDPIRGYDEDNYDDDYDDDDYDDDDYDDDDERYDREY